MKVITFTGGLGAQLFSASAYYYLNYLCEPVGVYLGYFNETPHNAVPGKKGDMSKWTWDLDCYNLMRDSFTPSINEHIKEAELHFHSIYPEIDTCNYIWDGIEKLRLGYEGFKIPTIAKKFPIDQVVTEYRNSIFKNEPFACVHIRRGDYLNSGTLVVDDISLFRAIKKIVKLVKKLLVVSDTPLTQEISAMITTLPIESVAIIGGKASLVHGLMRLSNILICSNSQYSLTAAFLRDSQHLTIIPSHYAGDSNHYTDQFLREINEFQILSY